MKKLTKEEILKKLETKFSDTTFYILPDDKVECICNKHDIREIYQIKQLLYYKKYICKECKHENNSRVVTWEHVKKRFIEFHGNKYDYTQSQYKNLKTKIKIICPIHGEFWQKPSNHYRLGCHKCRGLFLTPAERLQKLKDIHHDYEYPNFQNTRNKDFIEILCKKHGIFQQRYSDHLAGCGCPKCAESKGEARVRQFLEQNSIPFLQEFRVKNYRFDFFLPLNNTMIEFDGIQHFQPVDFFGGEETFKNIKERDFNKNKICSESGLNIVRISDISDIHVKLNFLQTK